MVLQMRCSVYAERGGGEKGDGDDDDDDVDDETTRVIPIDQAPPCLVIKVYFGALLVIKTRQSAYCKHQSRPTVLYIYDHLVNAMGS